MHFRRVNGLRRMYSTSAMVLLFVGSVATLGGCICWNCVPPSGSIGRFDASAASDEYAAEVLMPSSSSAIIAFSNGAQTTIDQGSWVVRPRFVHEMVFYIKNTRDTGQIKVGNGPRSGDVVFTSDEPLRDMLPLDGGYLIAKRVAGGSYHGVPSSATLEFWLDGALVWADGVERINPDIIGVVDGRHILLRDTEGMHSVDVRSGRSEVTQLSKFLNRELENSQVGVGCLRNDGSLTVFNSRSGEVRKYDVHALNDFDRHDLGRAVSGACWLDGTILYGSEGSCKRRPRDVLLVQVIATGTNRILGPVCD
jgi:hypothetical protein